MSMDDTFLLTYGDGVSDVDIRASLEFHKSPRKAGDGDDSAARLALRHGRRSTPTGRSQRSPRSRRSEGWISAGFLVFNRGVFDYMDGDDCILERNRWSGWPPTAN